jgi:aspartate/methionine/tyrosine aminotransferase
MTVPADLPPAAPPGHAPPVSPHPVFAASATTVFEVMSRLAREHDAINLGQGFPEGCEPEDVIGEAARALVAGPNQYPPMLGLPALRQAVARHEGRFYGRDLDWTREVVVTAGATGGLAASLFALLRPGDEVVLFEPLYDAYLPLVERAGGVPRLVTLEPPGWRLTAAALDAAIGPATRLVLLNNPHNPTGRVFDEDELSLLAAAVARTDALVLADEVYEHLVFDGRRHRPAATLPGLAGRTVKIGSAGKIFSLTGWKVGLVSGPADLLDPVAKAHQFLTFTVPPNLQAAVAWGLDKPDGYFAGLAAGLQARRDRFAAGLARLGFRVLPADGTYFLTVDIASTGFAGDDVAFCRTLCAEAGVAAIPLGAFHARKTPHRLARFCFAKPEATLDAALHRLAGIAPRRP